MTRRGRIVAAAVTLAALAGALLLAAGGADDGEPPRHPLRAALETVASGQPSGTGVGFVDLARLARGGHTRAGIEDPFASALGPGGDDLFEDAAVVERTVGIDPFTAQRAVSVGGSYTFGVRLDGVRTRPVERALERLGAPGRREGERLLIDAGAERSVPQGFAFEGLGPRAARVAVEGDSVAFASLDSARAGLLGDGTPVLEDRAIDLAVECLGDAVAARIVPARLTLSRGIGAQLVAVGMLEDGPERACFVGDDDDPLVRDSEPLERAFRLEREDPVADRPLGEAVAAVEIEMLERDGMSAGRVEIEPAAGTAPGFVFRALTSGALVAYLGHEGLFEARDR